MGDLPDMFCNVFRVAEKVIWFVCVSFTCPGKGDNRVDCNVGYVNAFGPGVPCHRLRENALGCFGGCEPGEKILAAICRGVACTDDCTMTLLYHRGRQFLPKLKQGQMQPELVEKAQSKPMLKLMGKNPRNLLKKAKPKKGKL